jgi:hypothetical protein
MHFLDALTNVSCQAADELPGNGRASANVPQGLSIQLVQAAIDRAGRGWERRIEVSIEGGHVTLHGRVRTYAHKQLAQHLVMQVPGVSSILNQLSVE